MRLDMDGKYFFSDADTDVVRECAAWSPGKGDHRLPCSVARGAVCVRDQVGIHRVVHYNSTHCAGQQPRVPRPRHRPAHQPGAGGGAGGGPQRPPDQAPHQLRLAGALLPARLARRQPVPQVRRHCNIIIYVILIFSARDLFNSSGAGNKVSVGENISVQMSEDYVVSVLSTIGSVSREYRLADIMRHNGSLVPLHYADSVIRMFEGTTPG